MRKIRIETNGRQGRGKAAVSRLGKEVLSEKVVPASRMEEKQQLTMQRPSPPARGKHRPSQGWAWYLPDTGAPEAEVGE